MTSPIWAILFSKKSISFNARICAARGRGSTPPCGICSASGRENRCANCWAERRARCAFTLRACAATLRRQTRRRGLFGCATISAATLLNSASAPNAGATATNGRGAPKRLSPTVRRALGDEAVLLVDANSCYRPQTAIEIGKMLQDNGVAHFEEPCPYWRPDWTRLVARALALDVAGGEQDFNLALWRYQIEDRVVDIAQPDVCYVGGVSRFLRVVEMANQKSIPVTPHSANLSLVTIFTLHLMGAIAGGGPYVEFSIEGDDYYPWQRGVYDDFPLIKDGQVRVPEEPGWGVRIRDDWLNRAQRQISEIGG